MNRHNINKTTKKEKLPKQSKTKQKNHKKTTEYFFLTLAMDKHCFKMKASHETHPLSNKMKNLPNHSLDGMNPEEFLHNEI